MAVYPFSPNPPADPTVEAVAVELEAMQAIAKVLAGVRDPRIRRRVLEWANERFNPVPSPRRVLAPAQPDTTAIADGGDLDVASLYEYFETPNPPNAPVAAQPSAPLPVAAQVLEMRGVRDSREDAPLDTMVKGFGSELQRLAIEWQTT